MRRPSVCTRDRGYLDPDGYLFIEGRADDTIIRGGENIAPAEIEEALLRHPAVAEVWWWACRMRNGDNA